MHALRAVWNTYIVPLLDLIVPARDTQLLVRRVTETDLHTTPTTDGGALPYHDPVVRALIWEIKYYANKRALELLAPLLAERLLELAQDEVGVPVLIPVPMHTSRRHERGHNQTELLCKAALSLLSEKEFVYNDRMLVRTRHTRPQQGLPEHARRKNVLGSMQVTHEEQVRGRVCIVMDDVATTGATLKEAARALHEAGARVVYTLAAAQS